MGPTASGKTDLALELAQKFPLDVISVDSGMIYRGMNIGTAKPGKSQLLKAPHRLIDICDPKETYSAAQFRLDALQEIDTIFKANKVPLLVGGTMLYFKVLSQGISPLPHSNKEIRTALCEAANKYGWQHLHERLAKVDPKAASRISVSDSQRIQRALEVYEITGKTITFLTEENPPVPLSYEIINVILLPKDREVLRKRIWERLQIMLANGLVSEVEALYKRGDLDQDLPSMRSVGYRQAWGYLAGKINYQEMQEKIYFATCQLAKRQMTWLKSLTDSNAHCFNCEDKDLTDKICETFKTRYCF